MKLIVIRHGESVADILSVNEGRADFELTEKGKLQAVKLSQYISRNYIVNSIFQCEIRLCSKLRASSTKCYFLVGQRN